MAQLSRWYMLSIVILCSVFLYGVLYYYGDKPIFQPVYDYEDSSLSISLNLIQNIIDEYVLQLSQANYDNVPSHIDIVLDGTSQHCIFPHLSTANIVSSLSNHRLFICGDSTAENTGLFFFWVLHKYLERNDTNYSIFNFQNAPSPSLTIPNMYSLSPLLRQHFAVQMNDWNNSFYFSLTQNINQTKYGKNIKNKVVYKHFMKENIKLFGQKVQKCGYYPSVYYLEKYSTDIIVTNFDLFFCAHLYAPYVLLADKYKNKTIPASTKHTFSGKIKAMLNDNINLENKLEIFIQEAINNNVSCVILYGPNAVCDRLYFNEWAEARDEWQKDYKNINKTLLRSCLNRIGYKENDLVVDNFNTSGFTMNGFEFCKYNTLTEFGTKYLNERMRQWVKYKQLQLDKNKTNNNKRFKLLYWNQWQLTFNRCDWTSDGRHYQPLLPIKAEIITNIIQKWC